MSHKSGLNTFFASTADKVLIDSEVILKALLLQPKFLEALELKEKVNL